MNPASESTHTPATLTIDNGPRRVRSILRPPDPAQQPAPASADARKPAAATRAHIATEVRIEVRKFVALLIDAIAKFPDCLAAVRDLLRRHAIPEPETI